MKVDKRQMKSAARLYAVQALFQMEVSGQTVESVTREFETHRFGATYDEGEFVEGDVNHFRAVVEAAVNWQAKIDQLTDRALVAAWPIDRIDPVLAARFRARGREIVDIVTPPKCDHEYVAGHGVFPEGKEPSSQRVLDHMAGGKPDAFDLKRYDLQRACMRHLQCPAHS